MDKIQYNKHFILSLTYTKSIYIVYFLKLKSNRDVAWMMVKTEVTVLERNLAIYSDMTKAIVTHKGVGNSPGNGRDVRGK